MELQKINDYFELTHQKNSFGSCQGGRKGEGADLVIFYLSKISFAAKETVNKTLD